MLRIYKTMVRPPLVEYCTVAWSPGYVKDKILIEKIQWRYSKIIPMLKDMDYNSRLRNLGLRTLEERRNRANLIQVYKMWKNLSVLRFKSFFELASNGRTRDSIKLAKHRSHHDLRQRSFLQSVLNAWNKMPLQ